MNAHIMINISNRQKCIDFYDKFMELVEFKLVFFCFSFVSYCYFRYRPFFLVFVFVVFDSWFCCLCCVVLDYLCRIAVFMYVVFRFGI